MIEERKLGPYTVKVEWYSGILHYHYYMENGGVHVTLKCFKDFFEPCEEFLKYVLSKKYKSSKIPYNISIYKETRNISTSITSSSIGSLYIEFQFFKRKFFLEIKIDSGMSKKDVKEIIKKFKKVIKKLYILAKN